MAFKEILLDRSPSIFVQLKGNPLSAAVDAQIDAWMQGNIDENEVETGNMGNLNRTADTSDAQLANMTNQTVQNSYHNAVLQKEAAQLRQQCAKLQVRTHVPCRPQPIVATLHVLSSPVPRHPAILCLYTVTVNYTNSATDLCTTTLPTNRARALICSAS